ncbi:hypothetical protein HYPSUDRAFT_208330, partial [Hypholoma sublateritium FD-334 SS-4]
WYLPERTDSSHQKRLLRAGDSDILLQPTFWVSEERFAELQAQVYSTSSASASRRREAAKPTSSKPNKTSSTAIAARPGRIMSSRPPPKAPLPRRNPPRVSHRESSARPSKKRAVEADSESETDRDYVDHPDSSMCSAPTDRVLVADSDVEMKTAAPSKKKKALAAPPTTP